MFYNTEIDFEHAEKMSPGERYRLSVPETVRHGEVWGLWNGKEWAVFTDHEGRECSPIWPSEQLARGWKRPGLEDFHPRNMDIDCWIDRWLTLMTNTGRMIAVFPTHTDDGLIISPAALLFDVMDELVAYG